MRKQCVKKWGIVLAAAMIVASVPAGVKETPSSAAGVEAVMLADEADGSAATGPAASEEPTGDQSQAKLNVKSVNKMAGKSFKLTVSNLETVNGGFPTVDFTSENNAVAKISSPKFATNGKSASATVKLLKKGSTKINVSVNGTVLTCKVKVVAKFSKADFGGYRPENFVTYCARITKAKHWSFVFDGEWGRPGKYGTTNRGLKIGMKLSDVKNMYGDVSLKKCAKKSDPFLYDYQFNTSSHKLKVSKYVNFSCKEGGINYNLRIYLTSKNKVFGFIMLGGDDFKKITRTSLNRSKTSTMRLV